ncbi:hypothetical protein ACIBAG_35730 [Streptomyces sp. NPDC051243]|uniref:hypothetical protein n=1 Tax=Streptomyces sp. NPDC051243 TaxID=3365646 RepID=UPI0037AD3C89
MATFSAALSHGHADSRYLLGALYGIALILAGRAGRASRVPFGPFLLAGALVGVLLGSYA